MKKNKSRMISNLRDYFFLKTAEQLIDLLHYDAGTFTRLHLKSPANRQIPDHLSNKCVNYITIFAALNILDFVKVSSKTL